MVQHREESVVYPYEVVAIVPTSTELRYECLKLLYNVL